MPSNMRTLVEDLLIKLNIRGYSSAFISSNLFCRAIRLLLITSPLLLLLIPQTVWAIPAQPVTEVPGGAITGVVTWTVGSSPYLVQMPLDIETSARLIIEPGVEVRFAADASLVVNGELYAIGTANQPITFTGSVGAVAGAWAGIAINAGGQADLAWCDIGGASTDMEPASLAIYTPQVTVSHCRIHDGQSSGVFLNYAAGAAQLADVQVERHARHGVWAASVHGGDPSLERLVLTDNQGAAIYQDTDIVAPRYRELSATGNGTDAITIASGILERGAIWDFADAGIPVHLLGYVHLRGGAALNIIAGSTLHFATDAGLEVEEGDFYALGEVDAPVTFTAIDALPGTWNGLYVAPGVRAILRHCDISYGGAGVSALLWLDSAQGTVESCHLHHSGYDAFQTSTTPVLRHNRIEQNGQLNPAGLGVRNLSPGQNVDARGNWWGDASGAHHPTLNPDGQGDGVSDGVLFDPWLTTPTGDEPPTAGVFALSLAGPTTVNPGQIADYLLYYTNRGATPVTGPLVLALPSGADYVSTLGGEYAPEQHAVVWDAGSAAAANTADAAGSAIPPGASGVLATKVRYQWGLPIGEIGWLAGFAASIYTDTATLFDNITPVTPIATQTLSEAQYTTIRQDNAELEALYQAAVAEGMIFGTAVQETLTNGVVVTQAVMLNLPTRAVLFLQQTERGVASLRIDGSRFTLENSLGGAHFDPALQEWRYFGGWAQGEAVEAAGAQSFARYGRCAVNCSAPHLLGLALSLVKIKAVQGMLNSVDCVSCMEGDGAACLSCAAALKGIPYVGEAINTWQIMDCLENCRQDSSQYGCSTDQVYCSAPGNADSAAHFWECNPWTGELTPVKTEYCNSYNRPDKWEVYVCLNNEGCVDIMPPPDIEQYHRFMATGIRFEPAKDPNAKYGPEGDLLPGERVTYTIEYANEGQGAAYGVFIVDALDAAFDLSSVQIIGPGRLITPTRTVIWSIGEVAPQGAVGAGGAVTVSAQLRADLIGGEVVMNQAVVHFPSVPEETPTNAVVNRIQPVSALPQRVQTRVQQPVAITLQGKEVSQAPLVFSIVEKPRYGALSGMAPDVIYTPMANFTGLDRFAFRVNNGVIDSNPATVEIEVLPGETDITPPTVRSTWPISGAVAAPIAGQAAYSDAVGSVYAPVVRIYFSEPLAESSVQSGTVQLRDGLDQPLLATLTYDREAYLAVLTPRARLLPNSTYWIYVASAVTDASGNPLGSDYRASFTTDSLDVHLPIISR